MATQTSTGDSLENKAAELLRLHQDPTLLTVVNVWDSISAKVVADTPGTAAIATASHAIAASWGYPDGEKIPVDTMIGAVGRIVEDQMRPLDEAARNVAAIMDAAISEGVPDFVLNARTDAFVLGKDRDPADVLADAVERGKAYLDA